MQATVVASPVPRVLVAAATLAVAALVLATGALVVTKAPSGVDDRVALASIPAGVSLQQVGDRAVAFVRVGDAVTAFVPNGFHPGELRWCASRGEFVGALSASRWTVDGAKRSGPGPAQLARYDVRLDGDDAVVSTAHLFGEPPVTWTEGLAGGFTDPTADVCPR
jgi:hypothetical protein